MPEPFVSTRKLTVDWGDCDPADIVFYPNYFRWFDAATAHHFKAAGLPKPELIRRYNVVGFPMVDTRAQFLAPTRHGDEVIIKTRITRFGTSSFDVSHTLSHAGNVAVEGTEKRVLVAAGANGDGIRPFPIPIEIKQLFGTT